MSEYYYELIIKPSKNYELFVDLITSLTNEAIEELDDLIIARSEDDLSDVEDGIKTFAHALDILCETTLTKKENIDWIKKYQESVKSIEIGKFLIRPSWDEKREFD